MSSARFETVLTPEPRLRQCVLLFGWLAMLTGLVLILLMPLAPVWRILCAFAWIGESLRELRGLTCGAKRLRLIRLDADGNIAGLRPDGRFEALTLLSGSVLLSRLGWLRVRFPDGSRYGELLRGDPAKDLEWQRLQLIWRHSRAAFGRQEGS
jgi:hypothetical protein